MADPISFGRWLRRRRKALDLTQAQLAEQVGYAEVTLRKIEADELRPSKQMAQTLATHLEIASADRDAFIRFARDDRRVDGLPLLSGFGGQVPRALPLPRSSNLPPSLTSFIGREPEIAEVKRLLTTTRLLTLTGTGGCGKTRLALRVATDLLDAYPDGVWLVELAPLADPLLVPKAITVALGVQEQPQQPIYETLATYLRSRCLLLVLDNCEHLIAACARLADDLLRSCPTLAVLATSREALRIAGEVTWRVPSLRVPDRGHLAGEQNDPVRILLDAEAAQLFVQRARTVAPGFTVTPANAAAVAEICWRLDGIPLAIELAAARIKLLSVEQVVARLGDRFQLLTGGSRTALPRQQTLRATIDWSYDLLSRSEQALLRRLAVFAGSFALDAAEAIGLGTGINRAEVLDILTELVDKSLVLVEDSGPARSSEARYRVLETIRQYARNRLVDAGELDVFRDRHRDWFSDLAQRAEPGLWGADQRRWLDRLETEHDNIRAALGWSLESDLAVGLRLASRVWRFWQVRGHIVEGGQWLATLLDKAREPTAERAMALLGAAILLKQQGDFDPVKALLEESLALYRGLGDKRGMGWVLENLGPLFDVHGDIATGRALTEEAVALAREVGETWRIGWALVQLADHSHLEGDRARARVLHEESLALFREAGEIRGIGRELNMLGDLALLDDEYPRARALFEETLAAYRGIGDQRGIGTTLRHIGNVEHLEGKKSQAAALYAVSFALLRKIGAENNSGDTLLWLGNLAVVEGDYARARTHYREALAIFQAPRVKPIVPFCLRLFAIVAVYEAGWARAVRLVAAAPPLGHFEQDAMVLIQRTGVDTGLSRPRSALSEEAFAAAWADGQAMTLEQAVAYADDES